ncbi:phospholipase A1 [Zobellia uliginosa]|uniref:Phosphatidylcholine 1-acylhydrolase n=1 Tax=Zobellia uliginosa TaxID=143224 RepID=A0ABY1KLY4_9FLAO|nr:phospholipase A [Zobellia uliginosa]SIS48598.1 phospholipase A1 [Zobellia uliginosa]
MKAKSSIWILMGLLFLISDLSAQALTRQEVRDTMQHIPWFTIHKDNYFITGVPSNKPINSSTADAKYQISFKQIITRSMLPWETYLYLTYSQKAFWDIYKDSYPFKEINFNPTIGVGKAFYDSDDRIKGLASLVFEHESNGRDSIFSRSWNRLSLQYSTLLSERTMLHVKAWLPYGYKSGNPDLIDYVGLGEVSLSHDFIRDRLIFEVKLRKGLSNDFKGMIRSRLHYRPFKHSSNQYIMLEWFSGHSENLIDYKQYHSMLRIGYVIKTNEFDILKRNRKRP